MEELRAFGLVIVGDEILSGRRSDHHFGWCRDYCSRNGLDISWVCYLPDELELLERHFRMIGTSGETCFCFGGIGATPDDLTRQAMARAHDRTLIRHPEAVRLIEDRFGAEAYPNRIKMAELPEFAELIPNAHNDIPGFSLGRIHCLPGFPEMARPMLDWVVQNRYRAAAGPSAILSSLVVEDLQESQLVPLLEQLQADWPGVKISSLPRMVQGGRRRIELGVRGPDHLVGEAMARLRHGLRQLGWRCP